MSRFSLGELYMTAGVAALVEGSDLGEWLRDCLRRHAACDWGDVGPDDWRANDDALATGARLFSVYRRDGMTVWLITEADRAATTFRLPDEY